MKIKSLYEVPELEIVELNAQDVIITSLGDGGIIDETDDGIEW